MHVEYEPLTITAHRTNNYQKYALEMRIEKNPRYSPRKYTV